MQCRHVLLLLTAAAAALVCAAVARESGGSGNDALQSPADFPPGIAAASAPPSASSSLSEDEPLSVSQPGLEDCTTMANAALAVPEERHHIAPYLQLITRLENPVEGVDEDTAAAESARILAEAEMGDQTQAEDEMHIGRWHDLLYRCALQRTGEELLPSLLRLELPRTAEALKGFYSTLYLLSWRAACNRDTLLHVAARSANPGGVKWLADQLRASSLKLMYKVNNKGLTPVQLASSEETRKALETILVVYQKSLKSAWVRRETRRRRQERRKRERGMPAGLGRNSTLGTS